MPSRRGHPTGDCPVPLQRPGPPAMMPPPCLRSGSMRTGSLLRHDHVPGQGAAVRFRSAGIATRLSARSAGRSSAWLGTSNGAAMGKSWSRCQMTRSGCSAS